MKGSLLIAGLFLALLVLSGCEEFELAQNLNKYDDNCEEKAKELFKKDKKIYNIINSLSLYET